jgi:hypothetical protein
MRKWLILLSVLFVTPLSAAPAWTWVDNDGQVHYSDRPVPGARQINLPGAQGFSAPQQAAPAPSQTAAAAPLRPAASYRTFNIVSPAQEATLWNIGGNLAVQIALDPALQTGHLIDLVLDGQRLDLNSRSTEFTLTDVFRGVHVLQAMVIDSSGSELLRSLTTTFMVQQTSIQNPNSPQAQGGQAAQNAN